MSPETQTQLDNLKGSEKAAILLLSLGQKYGSSIWEALSEDEVKEASVAMAGLGQITVDLVEEAAGRFCQQDVRGRRPDGQL